MSRFFGGEVGGGVGEGYCICGCDKNVYVLGFSFSYLGYFLRRDPRSR